MPNASPATHSTLGQRIDALLGPLETEAYQYREAIDLGRQQVRQLQEKVALAEQALAGIEQKMGRVLDTLTQEEPLLARAIGRSAEATPAPAAIVTPAPAPTPTPTPTPTPAPEPLDAAAVPATPCVEPTTPAQAMDAVRALVNQPPQMHTPEEDAKAIHEIIQMLSVDPAEYATVPAGPLADAATQAVQTALGLGGSLPGSDTRR